MKLTDDLRRLTANPLITLPGASTEVPAPSRPAAGYDDSDTPTDIIDLMILDPFVSGREPFARSARLSDVIAGSPLLPPGARTVRESRDRHVVAKLASGAGWTAQSTHWTRTRNAHVTVTAVTDALAEQLLAAATEGAVEPPTEDPDSVRIGFWHLAAHGPHRVERDIETPSWDGARGNYAGPVAEAVDRLMALGPDDVRGRLLLLHGPPGTGKTSLLRSLARQWQDWCRVDCVLDPEHLFGAPSYLLNVALGEDDDAPDWRLLLLEDCDELIRAEAKSSSGQALSRLLNLTDGLLGQGRNVLVAITTNENLALLHPAVVRPGRALAQIEVGRLSPSEAVAWLAARGYDGPVDLDRGATVAELYALLAGTAPVEVTPSAGPGTGLYL